MKTGDLVWYRQPGRGGYGYDRRVPAVFSHATGCRVSVEVLMRTGQRKVIAVHPRNVSQRQPGESIEWTR